MSEPIPDKLKFAEEILKDKLVEVFVYDKNSKLKNVWFGVFLSFHEHINIGVLLRDCILLPTDVEVSHVIHSSCIVCDAWIRNSCEYSYKTRIEIQVTGKSMLRLQSFGKAMHGNDEVLLGGVEIRMFGQSYKPKEV